MSQTPVISRVLIVTGLPHPPEGSLQNTHFLSLSIGLVIDDNQVFWGEYQPDSDSGKVFTVLQEKVIPVLEGRPLAAFREIMEELDGLTETAVLSRPHSQPTPSTISRRGFLTGKVETAVKIKQIEIERPLPPALRYCISEILITALAATSHLTIAELMAHEYDLPLQSSFVPLHLIIDAENPVPDDSLLSLPIQSLGYHITGRDPQDQLGANGEKLQRFIRQLTELLRRVTPQDYRPTLHLDVAGGLGQLFDNNTGRILGAIYGLEQAAKPYPLRISDPILVEEPARQVDLMHQLMEFLRMRGMKSQLSLNTPVQSLTGVKQLAENQAAHMLEIFLPRMGTSQQSVEAVRFCQQNNTAVMLRDGRPPYASQFALAARPDLIATISEPNHDNHAYQIYREMAKTITFFTQIRA